MLLCWHGRADFDRLLVLRPDFNRAFLQRALDSIDAARDWMLLLGRKTALERVATLLLTLLQKTSYCCGDHQPSKDKILTIPLTRLEMADFLGLRLETVSRQLKLLETSGAIKRLDTRRILVLVAESLTMLPALTSRASPSHPPPLLPRIGKALLGGSVQVSHP